MERNNRRFIRHPSHLPLICHLVGHDRDIVHHMRDISLGGLSFTSHEHYNPGDRVVIKCPVLEVDQSIEGEVIWCENDVPEHDGEFACGLRFESRNMQFRARLVEQMCHIEAYRRDQESRGRTLTSEEAAREWIPVSAHRFPPQFGPG